MSEKKTQTIVIDDVEHELDSMTDEQKMLINHVMDLERKISFRSIFVRPTQCRKTSLYQYVKAIS